MKLRKDLSFYIEKAIQIHGDVFDFSHSVYNGASKKMEIGCKNCGHVFWKAPNNLTHSSNPQGCPKCALRRRGNKRKANLEYYQSLCDEIHGKGRFTILPNQEYTKSSDKYNVLCGNCGKIFSIRMNLLVRKNDKRGCCVNNGVDQKLSDKEVQEKIDKSFGVGRYIYKPGTYKGQNKPITVYCSVCDEWFVKSYAGNMWNVVKPTGHMKCSMHGGHSNIEEPIKEFLEEFNLQWKTDRRILDGKEIDFYVPSHKIGIEVNGIYWHSEDGGKYRTYHKEKTDLAESKGIQLIHLREDLIIHHWPKVRSMLMAKFGLIEKKIYARKCEIVKLTSKESRDFLNATHISGDVPASIRYGLVFNNELIAVMTFGKSRYDKNVQYELYRYSQQLETIVIGGFSKLLKHFLREYDNPSLVSYAHRDFSIGKVYEANGFVYSHNTHPEHLWFHQSDPYKLYNTRAIREIVLKNQKYDPSISIVDNAKNMKYNRIYNSGSRVYYFVIDFALLPSQNCR